MMAWIIPYVIGACWGALSWSLINRKRHHHAWTKWSIDQVGQAYAKQHRHCTDCGVAQFRQVQDADRFTL